MYANVTIKGSRRELGKFFGDVNKSIPHPEKLSSGNKFMLPEDNIYDRLDFIEEKLAGKGDVYFLQAVSENTLKVEQRRVEITEELEN